MCSMCRCACVYACVRILLHSPLSEAHVGAPIFCREGTLADRESLYPPWVNIGTLGTEGKVGDTADDDVQESWGWTLSDTVLLQAARAATGGSQ